MTVQEFLKSDRQWTRACRIAHAKAQKSKAKTDAERQFWNEVLDANGTLPIQTPIWVS